MRDRAEGDEDTPAYGRGMMAHASQRILPRSFLLPYEGPAHRPVPARRSEGGGPG
jgi:hypothetical protein